MSAYIIEAKNEIKGAFDYNQQLSADSERELVEYARANYGIGYFCIEGIRKRLL